MKNIFYSIGEKDRGRYLGFMIAVSILLLMTTLIFAIEFYRWYKFTYDGVRTIATISYKDVSQQNGISYKVSYVVEQDTITTSIASDNSYLQVGGNEEIYYLPQGRPAEFVDVVTSAYKLKVTSILALIPIGLFFIGFMWPSWLLQYLNGEIFASN